MNDAVRMIAVDLDGTLLNSRKRVSAEDAEAVRAAAARGVEFVPVTGRNFSTALPMVEDLLTTGPLISNNGALIRSKNGETFFRALLPVSVAVAVLRATREFRPYTVLMYDQSGEGQFRIEVPATGSPGEMIAPPDGVALSPWVRRVSAAVRFTDSLEKELEGDPLEIMFAGPVPLMQEVATLLGNGLENGLLHGLKDSLGPLPYGPFDFASFVPPLRDQGRQGGRGSDYSNEALERPFRLLRTEYPARNFSIQDVIRGDCSKGHALAYWSRFRGIPREQILAIGDNYNDLEMLRFAGIPVVMGNAEERLKQEGWAVTLDCDSGGVARAIEQYVL